MDEVMFLGKKYSFPHELYEYILYCRKFQDDRERLLLLILNRTQEKVYSFPDTEIEKLLQDSCRHTIRFLGEAGVYNITEEDLLSSNSAFRKFKDLQDEAVQKMTEIGKLSEKEFNLSKERVEIKRIDIRRPAMLIITNILYFITQSFLQIYIQFSIGTRSIVGTDGTVPIYYHFLSALLMIIMIIIDIAKTKKKKYWILEICILLGPFFFFL